MMRSRHTLAAPSLTTSSSTDESGDVEENAESHRREERQRRLLPPPLPINRRWKTWRITLYTPPLPLVVIVVWCIFQSYFSFQILLDKNLGHQTDSTNSCPALPERLLHPLHEHPSNLSSSSPPPLTRQQVEEQMQHDMEKANFGTMGDTILKCKRDAPRKSCQGIVKVFRSRTVYQHVKRCLSLLADEDFAPNLLYNDDATLTLVEEDRGRLTMLNAPIPLDFDRQVRRIVCLLRRHKIIHRDIGYTNFVVDAQAGKISLIDFGDAFVGLPKHHGDNHDQDNNQLAWWKNAENWNGRNVINLFNIWLHGYDEEARLEAFIDNTTPQVRGKRQWRPPPRKWKTVNQMKVGSLFLKHELTQ